MKILHVVASIDPAGGGPPQVAVRLAAAQAKLGHEVTLLSYAPSDADSAARIAQAIGRVPHVELIRREQVRRGGRGESLFAANARRSLKPLLASVEWVHIHGVWESILKSTADDAAARGVPYCFRPAGMLDPWSLSQKKWKKRLALAMGYRASLSRAAFIHTLNADEARLILPLKLAAPAKIIPNGIFVEELADPPAPGTFRARCPGLGEAPFALFMARLHYKKGLDVLAEAMRQVAHRRPDLHAVVAGPDDGARADFDRQVASSGIGDRVHVVGPLYGPDKLAALVDATMFVLPSRQEGFSVAITEALACGLPAVISDACHFPEVAEQRCGFVVPVDAAATADALARVLDDPVEARAMGQRGRAMVLERFTWPKVAEQTIEAYVAHRRKGC